mmetsp:Transcript_5976/g.21569  ORF Transcript_5976/g.21569 Transcript_5976/m.21569 type:complete len:303 (-) Transcript_5976:245-1153(-)
MRNATSVSASALSRASICLPVSCFPSLPLRAESLTPNVMLNVGGSIGVDSRGSVTSTEHNVSVTVASPKPAIVTMSPLTHSSIATRVKLFEVKIFDTRPTSRTSPDCRFKACTLSPTLHDPFTTRPVTTRPRNGSRSIILTSIENGSFTSPLGAGTCSTSNFNSASMLPLPSRTCFWHSSSDALDAPARALAYATGKSNCSSSAPSEANKSNSWLSTASHPAFVTPSRSTLLITTTGFKPFFSAFPSTNFVCAIAPSLASTKSTHPSTISSARSTSPPKSACPGVSTALMRVEPYAKVVYFA